MKCYNCQMENKNTAKFCKGCGADLTYVPWRPGWRWHLKVLGIIYLVVIVLFFVARFFLDKFDRNLPTWEREYPMYEKTEPTKNVK
ncbi:MAG: hypothetical protein JW983_08885 [Elusimicrobia bacterium]|nr:hypothetical protein [Elusimicrobiota bacterium]